MTYILFAPDTGSFGSPDYQVPIVVPIGQEEQKPESRNRRWGKIIQMHKGKDDQYLITHNCRYSMARRQLAQENIHLVVHIAKKYLGKGLSLDDLVGEGNLGLMRAVEDYKPDYEFSTYAEYWIRHYITDAFDNQLRENLKIPYHVCESRERINQTESYLKQELGRRPSSEEIARRFNETFYPDGPVKDHITEEHVDALKKAENTRPLIKISAKGLEFVVSIEDRSLTPEQYAIQKERLKSARDLFKDKTLDENEKTVLTLYYGLDYNDDIDTINDSEHIEAIENFTVIASIVGLTRQRISQIYHKAIKKLKEKSSSESDDDKKAA